MQWVITWTRYLSGSVNQRERERARARQKSRDRQTDRQTEIYRQSETTRHGKWGGRDTRTQSDSERVVKEMDKERERENSSK